HAEFIDDMMDYQNIPDYEQQLPFVITPNSDQMVKLDQTQHHVLKEELKKSLFVLPDGQPIVWFSKWIRKPLKARLTGSDLFPLLWQQAKQNQQKILVIVSDEIFGEKLKQDYDNIVCYAPPFFEINTPDFDKICQELIEQIKDFQPKFVITGISFPKQEWLNLTIYTALKKQKIPSPLFLCLGASAEFYVGVRKRAPLFLQKVGLEWLHRLWLEPGRMWRRYILGVFSLLNLFGKEMTKEIFQKKS
ncbi:WecB/TagA/CpsF family glycosyltransferase, partial [Candidatus Marithioploca araucensis]|nr:WecB/TagA/CpsF family glycosyltransferase [Candidatus Marithioploca araucensis]